MTEFYIQNDEILHRNNRREQVKVGHQLTSVTRLLSITGLNILSAAMDDKNGMKHDMT